MERREKIWLGILIVVFVLFNAITLSPLVPWQKWLLWSHPTPDQQVVVEFEDYTIKLPPQGIQVKTGQYVEFVGTTKDVTYGFGVFKPGGPMIFQMQVLPGRQNRITWKFDAPGQYDVRSTEYSGPRHSDMFLAKAINVSP